MLLMVKLNLCQNQQSKKQDIIPCISVLLSQSLKQKKLCVNEYMCTVEKLQTYTACLHLSYGFNFFFFPENVSLFFWKED